MTPEQKFKEWALDPNGGGWKQDPNENHPSISNLGVCEMWRNEQAAFLAGMEADRWISVEERLPEVSKTDKDRSEFVNALETDGQVEKGFYNYKTKEWSLDWGGEYFSITVTHWQPLPKPPKP